MPLFTVLWSNGGYGEGITTRVLSQEQPHASVQHAPPDNKLLVISTVTSLELFMAEKSSDTFHSKGVALSVTRTEIRRISLAWTGMRYLLIKICINILHVAAGPLTAPVSSELDWPCGYLFVMIDLYWKTYIQCILHVMMSCKANVLGLISTEFVPENLCQARKCHVF